jgi:hypothetical protein
MDGILARHRICVEADSVTGRERFATVWMVGDEELDLEALKGKHVSLTVRRCALCGAEDGLLRPTDDSRLWLCANPFDCRDRERERRKAEIMEAR